MSCSKLCFETELDRALRAHSESGGFGVITGLGVIVVQRI
jgi:hypothetical protein